MPNSCLSLAIRSPTNTDPRQRKGITTTTTTSAATGCLPTNDLPTEPPLTHSLQRLPVGSDIWFVSRNRIRWQIGNKILATSPLSNLADRQHVRPVRGMPDRLSRGFWYAMSDTTETLRLFSIRIRLQTCKKRGWLGCVNPASWLPLAAGASSRNLTFALTCRAVYQNSFGAPYHFLTSHSYFTRVSSMFEWHAIEHIRAPYPRYNRSAPAARATSERGFR